MPRDSRLSRPQDYVDETRLKFLRNNKVDYGEAFKSKPSEPPFTINRFDASDLQNKLKKGLGKKQVLNPRLNFVGGDPQENFIALKKVGLIQNQTLLSTQNTNLCGQSFIMSAQL
jgi:hypothetical protein